MNTEENKQKVTNIIEKRLVESEIAYNRLSTQYEEDGLLRDGTPKAVFVTIVYEPLFGSDSHIITDADTLELLYVQTGPASFVDIDVFFSVEENS